MPEIFNIITSLLFLTAIGSFVSGIYVYKTNLQKKSSLYYLLLAIGIGVWVLSRGFLQITDIDGAARFWGYFLFVPPVFVVLFLLLFSIFISSENKRLNRLEKAIIFIPWSLVLAITLVPGTIARGVEVLPDGINNVIYGDYFVPVYAPILLIYLIAIFPILFRHYGRAGAFLKLRLRYIIFGTFISIAIGILANLVLPIFGLTNLVWLGPLSAIVLVVMVGYAITRRMLWDFKLILTELVVFIVLLILLLGIFLSAGDADKLIFQIATFILMSIFSVFLIRGIFREIEANDDIDRLAHDLQAANRRLLEIDNEKSDFVSIASHQLRTPLTLIKGYASMMLEESFGRIENPKVKEIVVKVLEASERLVAMIDDFLDISKIEEGKMSYLFKKLEISELVVDVVDELGSTKKDYESKVSVNIPDGRKFYIIGDGLKLRQVILNLLDNSFKYSPKGNPISISVYDENSNVIVSIKDTGMGIPSNVIPKLFKKYSRAEQISKLHTEGRGLGLYIARQIMEAHGGRIWAESKGEHQGTVMYLAFKEFREEDSRREIKRFVTDIRK